METADRKRRVLAVEDDPIQAKILAVLIGRDYDVAVAGSGEECLQVAAGGDFDLILMDVMLPGISGYEACRKLKESPQTSAIPVMFLSANFDILDRLQGLEAGGFDYLNKPVVKAELLRKMEILLKHFEERRTLQQSADFAASTAMTAMTSASEQGLVLQFMRSSFSCLSYRSLAEAILAATQMFGVDAVVQIRGAHEVVSIGSNGPCTPIEESVLANIGKGGRIVDLRQRTAINYERVTLIVRNMPTDDAERYGRLKDHLTMLLEGADARCGALDLNLRLDAEAQRMIEVVGAIGVTLGEVTAKSQDLHTDYGDVFNRLLGRLEQVIPLLELSSSQERMLNGLLADTSAAYVALGDKEHAVNLALDKATEVLHQVAAAHTP